MTRIKRGVMKAKTRKNILKLAKGYRFGRGTKKRQAKEAITHAGVHAYTHRKQKKGDFRRLWQIKINAAVRPLEVSYSRFMGMLTAKNIEIDRKILADLAENNSEIFTRVVEEAKK